MITADTERARLERNLHDGAQQRVLAVLYELRVLRDGHAASGPSRLTAVMDSAIVEAQGVVADLRDVAHGIYPVILAESGLRAALLSLADSAQVPVTLGTTTTERFSSLIERTAYIVVAEAVDQAAKSGAEEVRVRIARNGDSLSVEVEGAGPGEFTEIADRVGAVGGSVMSDGATLRAEFAYV